MSSNLKLYKQRLREINEEAHDLAIRQLELIKESNLLGDELGLDLDVEPFPVEAEYKEHPVKMFRFTTPLFPPRLKVSLSLSSGNRTSANKNDPYSCCTYAHVYAIWKALISRAIEQVNVPRLMLEKALVIYDYSVPFGRIQDYDAYDERCVNNALCQLEIIKDDNCKVLTAIKRMSYSHEKKLEITVIEDDGKLTDIVKLEYMS